uniref:hypothetical protein n=1 Tax=Paractinoplanes polyasparticus TaxID=2856853 RepID=UPI001C84E44C|nr:hypothetical protein [Actinoplanes polyasparticus]
MAKDRTEDRHAMHRHMVGFDDADWEELGQVVGGDPERGDVIRRLVAAFLKRPGAKMPRRKDYEQG